MKNATSRAVTAQAPASDVLMLAAQQFNCAHQRAQQLGVLFDRIRERARDSQGCSDIRLLAEIGVEIADCAGDEAANAFEWSESTANMELASHG